MKLSIIIPIYNVENYLSHCLDSVICDGVSDYEIIAVNDGSTDSSPKILGRYCDSFPNLIKRIDKENGGLGSARNAGLMHASGEYVVFLDSDDFLAYGAVEEIINLISETNSDIIFFDQIFFNSSGRQVMCYRGAGTMGPFSLDSYPQILFFTPNAGNKIFRKSLFDNTGIAFPPRQWFEDINSIYLLYPNAEAMVYVNKGWNCHLQRDGSITHSANTARNLEMIDACSELLEYYSHRNLCPKELEYCIFYNELLTSVDRVNLIDPSSEVQEKLIDWFISHFPDFRNNQYISSMSMKHKVLTSLIMRKRFRLLNILLRLNNLKHR